jgi:hypothetical protein
VIHDDVTCDDDANNDGRCRQGELGNVAEKEVLLLELLGLQQSFYGEGRQSPDMMEVSLELAETAALLRKPRDARDHLERVMMMRPHFALPPVSRYDRPLGLPWVGKGIVCVTPELLCGPLKFVVRRGGGVAIGCPTSMSLHPSGACIDVVLPDVVAGRGVLCVVGGG